MPRTAPRLLLVLLLTGLHHDVRRLAVLASHGAASPISAPPTACAAHDAADPTVPSALRFISGYTDATYARMRDDAARTEAYRRAIAAHAGGRVVLDIGTGGLALLAIMAAQAGASQVYACEASGRRGPCLPIQNTKDCSKLFKQTWSWSKIDLNLLFKMLAMTENSIERD